MNSTVGRYKTSSWTFIPGSRIVTIYNILDNSDLSSLNVMSIQRTAIPSPTFNTSLTGGSVNTGIHYYHVTMVNNLGESLLGAVSSPITVSSGNQKVSLNVPLGNIAANANVSVTQRNIYRTNAGVASSGTSYYIGSINDNVTNVFIDSTADNTTTPAPASPTTTAGFALAAPSLVNCQALGYAAPLTAPSVTGATAGGSLGVGNYYWAITFVIGSSETIPGPNSITILTTILNKTVTLRNVPIGPWGTTQRNIYRTNVGGTQLYLQGSITGNSVTTFVDNTADSTTTAAPTVSTAYNIIYNSNEPVLNATDIPFIKLDVVDSVRDENFGALRTIPQILSELPPTDSQVAPYTDTNLASGTITFYEIPAQSWRNFGFELICTATGSPSYFILYGTLDNTLTASVPPLSVGWCNITNQIFGVPQLQINPGTTQLIANLNIDGEGNQLMYNRFCLIYIVTNSTNFWQGNVIQF